jgi:hypothetical protein
MIQQKKCIMQNEKSVEIVKMEFKPKVHQNGGLNIVCAPDVGGCSASFD